MNSLLKQLSLYFLLLLPISLWANQPDSVFLFSYANANGQSGLLFAWSTDANEWFSIADRYNYVRCDFGPWGWQKKMFRPHLMQSQADGEWHCLWAATQNGKVLAHASSPDLLKWSPQHYFTPVDSLKYIPQNVHPTSEKTIVLNGVEEKGWVQRVPFATVEQLIRYADHQKFRQMQNAERTDQDSTRFAGLQAVEAVMQVDAAQSKSISDHLIGIFFEDINYAADGGLYAELIQNRDFEYSLKDGSPKKWNSGYAWYTSGKGGTLDIAISHPIHANNPHYAVFNVLQPGVALCNKGFDGIVLKKGDKYNFSAFVRVAEGSKGGKVLVKLLDEKGTVLAQTTIHATKKKWNKQKAILSVKQDASSAVLAIIPQEKGRYHLDMISLFPQKTFKGHKNGLRADLAQALADLKPRFVRFPGGCVAHGDGIDNMYDWKGSIGSLEARKPLRNLWGYHQTRGLGYFEYFQFCEDIGAAPVPVLAAGVPCQNSGTCSHGAKNEADRYGQQGGIPMEQMNEYIQDVLDLIEYANGDARKTVWGRKRAEAGHPKPFNLKFIGIGNEDMITDIFKERFTMIFNAIKEKHPEITVIGTTGPFYEGSDYDEGWALASQLNVPIVDEHYYVPPGWFIHNQDFYDHYDRSKPKVYLGEYAAHLPGRPNNLETALAEALYLTSVERNGDLVSMVSYAPLLAKEGHTQWNPDLIYFNNTEVKPTVGYYTQQMYGQNAGTEYVPSVVSLNNKRDAVRKRIGVSVVHDGNTGDYILKLVNMLPVEVNTQIKMDHFALENSTASKILLTSDPTDQDLKPVYTDFELKGTDFSYSIPAYSFTVIRVHGKMEKKN